MNSTERRLSVKNEFALGTELGKGVLDATPKSSPSLSPSRWQSSIADRGGRRRSARRTTTSRARDCLLQPFSSTQSHNTLDIIQNVRTHILDFHAAAHVTLSAASANGTNMMRPSLSITDAVDSASLNETVDATQRHPSHCSRFRPACDSGPGRKDRKNKNRRRQREGEHHEDHASPHSGCEDSIRSTHRTRDRDASSLRPRPSLH